MNRTNTQKKFPTEIFTNDNTRYLAVNAQGTEPVYSGEPLFHITNPEIKIGTSQHHDDVLKTLNGLLITRAVLGALATTIQADKPKKLGNWKLIPEGKYLRVRSARE